MSFVGLSPVLLIPFKGLVIPSFPLLAVSIIAGMLHLYGMFPYYKALSIEEVSRVLPLWRFIPLFVLLFSCVFIGERLTWHEGIAFLLLVAGGYLISIKNLRDPLKIGKAFYFMVFSSFLFGIHYTLAKYVYSNQPYYDGFVWIRIGAFLGAMSALSNKKYRNELILTLSSINLKITVILFVQGLLVIIGLALLNFAMTIGPISLVSASAGFQSIFVFLAATVLSIRYPNILQEEISKKIIVQKSFAIVLMIVGACVIVLV